VVTAATEGELSLLTAALKARRLPLTAPFPVYGATLKGERIILAVTSVGKVNAASAATLLLERYRPRLLINCGCGGAYPGSGLHVGHLAVASAEIYGDEGVITADGWLDLKAMGLTIVTKEGHCCHNEMPLALLPAERAMQLAAALGVPCRRGKFVTVSTCSGMASRGEELWRRHRALCENMEGAAAAHVALLWGVDCLEVRGISNMVEDRNLATWDIDGAAEAAQRFVLKFIETCGGGEEG
jgi:futalosine hydrolase